jgi:hypothetical protein
VSDCRFSIIRAQRPGPTIVEWTIAVVLLVAATSKAAELGTSPSGSASLLKSRGPQVLIINGEIILAAALTQAPTSRVAHFLSVPVFMMFANVAGISALKGASGCGCMGSFQIPPLFTLSFDIAAAAALVFWWPHRDLNVHKLPGRVQLSALAVTTLILCVGNISILRNSSAEKAPGVLMGEDSVASAAPMQWVGQHFPLWKYIDQVEPSMEADTCTVLFYNLGCDKCRRILPYFTEGATSAKNVLLVETSPFQPHDRAKLSGLHWGQLNGGFVWQIPTPVEVQIVDGRVAYVALDIDVAEDQKTCCGKPPTQRKSHIVRRHAKGDFP